MSWNIGTRSNEVTLLVIDRPIVFDVTRRLHHELGTRAAWYAAETMSVMLPGGGEFTSSTTWMRLPWNSPRKVSTMPLWPWSLTPLTARAIGAWLVSRIHAHLHVLFMEGLILFGGAFMLWHSWR